MVLSVVETDFQIALVNGLKRQGVYAKKWPDSARAVVKPFDICVAYGHQFVPIEVKLKKLKRKKVIGLDDIVVTHRDFEGNQLPELSRIWDNNHGYPRVAAFIMREYLGQVLEKRGWIISIALFRQKPEWSVQDFEEHSHAEGLVWVPTVGWTVPGYPRIER